MGKDAKQFGQLGLIPIRALWCSPANLGTADLKQVCRCDDGSDYAIKESETDPADPTKPVWTAHNEYFCYRLAHTVGIPTPSYHFIELQSKTIAFGSRWEGGVQPTNWWDRVVAKTIPPDEILPILAKIYAFDLFVHNIDRHANNFLIRQQHLGHAVIALDYSRAWSYHGFPLPALPMNPSQNTVLLQRQLKDMVGQYVTEDKANEVLDRLRSVDTDVITQIVGEQPESWLTKQLCQDIISWWSSETRIARIESIRAGIKDGTYL